MFLPILFKKIIFNKLMISIIILYIYIKKITIHFLQFIIEENIKKLYFNVNITNIKN